jgi:hypothetical protein
VTEPDLPAPYPDQPTPALADVVDISDWLVRQGGRIAHTPADLVAWLHQRVAAIATDPQLLRHARLGNVDDHYQRVGALLAAAISDGWASHELDGVELIERYAHDETFRANLDAAAGVAVYTAVRADTTLPADEYLAAAAIPAQRQRHLIKAIEDHAARYAKAGLRPARYIAEAHVPGGANTVEWDWIAYHIAAHPDVLQRPVMPQQAIDARDRALAEELDLQALDAFQSGDHQHALDLIDEAEIHQPRRDWDAVRTFIRGHIHQKDPAADGSQPGPTAGTAFARPPQVQAGPAAATAPAPPPAFPNEPVHRGSHR